MNSQTFVRILSRVFEPTIRFIFVTALASTLMLAQEQPVPPAQAANYKLVFQEDFTKPLMLGERWHEGIWWYHKHAPLTNIASEKSSLSLTWTRGQQADDTSISTLGRDTRQCEAFQYGYFEARMRWDVVNGAWPAFWLIPAEDARGEAIYDGQKDTGELDIFEGQGDHPHTFYGTIHEWVDLHDHSNKYNSFQLPANVDFSQYHTYGLLWTPGKVTWFFDNRPLHTEETPQIFDRQHFFLVLGMAAGHDWKAGDLTGITADKMTLNVDWVRVWQH